jgi:hypothetical protein
LGRALLEENGDVAKRRGLEGLGGSVNLLKGGEQRYPPALPTHDLDRFRLFQPET